ncbi:MAG: hypothetical protein ABL958_00840 [Bdellovibrionia bacterium]
MKFVTALVLFTALGLAPAAHARVFFKRTGILAMTYSNIFTGTKVLVQKVPFEFRYSDDNAACIILVGGKQIECRIDRRDANTVSLYQNAQGAAQFLGTILAGGGQSAYVQNLNRILSTQPFTSTWFLMNYSREKGMKQLHDKEPESFHVYFDQFAAEIPLGEGGQIQRRLQ